MGIIRFKEYHDRLIKGVEEVLRSDAFREFLSFSARFKRYSFGNALLIWVRCPNASHVAGMKTWNSIGRRVRKGEKGIAIFAPLVKKDSEDETKPERLIGFRAVYVWDVSQTEGKPVPEINTKVPVMEGDANQLFNRILRAAPVPVEYEAIPGKKRGYYMPRDKKIVLSSSLVPEEKSKTLLHELAHHLSCGEKKASSTDRATEEVIAEGAAFMAAAHFGLDSSGYSFPYVASWGRDPELVLSAGRSIRRIAGQLIEMVESSKKTADKTLEYPW